MRERHIELKCLKIKVKINFKGLSYSDFFFVIAWERLKKNKVVKSKFKKIEINTVSFFCCKIHWGFLIISNKIPFLICFN